MLDCAAVVTVAAVPDTLPVTSPVNGPANASEVTVPSKYAFLHSFVEEPKSYVLSAFGIMCEVNSPPNYISSESASPMLILPHKTKIP